MLISDWSSDVCSSDLRRRIPLSRVAVPRRLRRSAAHHRRLAPAAPRHRSPYGGSAMKHRFALSLMLSVAAPVWAEPPADIGESVEALRKKVGAPGVSIAIVEDGKTTLSRGWGVRKLGERAPIDAQTIFQTGSTGKAMTAAALAVLVDEGKIGWDDPVIQHMPWFRMYDPWGPREITIRALPFHPRGGPETGR